MPDTPPTSAAPLEPGWYITTGPLADAFIEHYGDRQELELFTDAKALLAEVDRLNRAITRVLRLLADQEAYCGDERLDVPSWVQSVRKALNDAG